MHSIKGAFEVCEIDGSVYPNQDLKPPAKISWWKYAVYRLYRWVWNPIYSNRPELMVPIAEEFSQMVINRLGAQKYLEYREWWKEVKDSHERP